LIRLELLLHVIIDERLAQVDLPGLLDLRILIAQIQGVPWGSDERVRLEFVDSVGLVTSQIAR